MKEQVWNTFFEFFIMRKHNKEKYKNRVLTTPFIWNECKLVGKCNKFIISKKFPKTLL